MAAAHLSNHRGSLVLKRSFRGVSPIRRATGTRDPAVVEQLDIMLHALYSQGRLDILESIARGRLHPLQVLSEWRRGRELSMAAADVMPRLLTTWTAWESAVPGEDHRSSIGTTRRALRIPEAASLEALPDLLQAYAARNATKVRSVNLARAHARAFLRDTVGTAHPLYLRVKDMRPLARKPRERGTPHPLPVILELVPRLEALAQGAGAMCWSMAGYGMGNKEYWRDGFDTRVDRVLVHGQKRKGRDRELPRWTEAPAPPVCWEGRFRDLLREASGGQVMIYDLRRSFARWMEEAGIIETNRNAYMGHGPKTIGQLYTFGQLPGQLAADAEKLVAYQALVTGGMNGL